MRPPRATALWAFGVLEALALAGCDPTGPLVYTAAAYQANGGCIADYAPIGLVEGVSLSSSCAPVCLLEGDQLYVSTVCPPYPAEAVQVDPSDPDCQAALAALSSAAFCGEVTPADSGASE